MSEWQTMDSAPKDGSRILGWCVREADTVLPSSEYNQRQRFYAGLSFVDDGPHVIVWGSAFNDKERKGAGWFRFGSEFEEVARPTRWLPIPADPLDAS